MGYSAELMENYHQQIMTWDKSALSFHFHDRLAVVASKAAESFVAVVCQVAESSWMAPVSHESPNRLSHYGRGHWHNICFNTAKKS